jgi:hypothetical protein
VPKTKKTVHKRCQHDWPRRNIFNGPPFEVAEDICGKCGVRRKVKENSVLYFYPKGGMTSLVRPVDIRTQEDAG